MDIGSKIALLITQDRGRRSTVEMWNRVEGPTDSSQEEEKEI